MYAFFDTETTGLWNFRRPVGDPSQPNVCQLGVIVTDESGRTKAELNALVQPDGWVIGPDAEAIHGITQQDCIMYGLPKATVAQAFIDLVTKCSRTVSHNWEFDNKLVHQLFVGTGVDIMPFQNTKGFCTMISATNVCRIPGKYGKFKWPKLQEAHRHFFDADFEGAHDAMADVRALVKVFFALKDKHPGLINA